MTRHRRTLLFSTTRSWNPGDDFILFGLRRLIEQVIGPFNALVYNRHPDLHAGRRLAGRKGRFNTPAGNFVFDIGELLGPHVGRYDNSWRPDQGLDHLDAVIFAGTPEWAGIMLEPLTASLATHAVPVAYLGLGGVEEHIGRSAANLPAADQSVLARAGLITVRDQLAERLLAPFGPVRLPCPALFAVPHARPRSTLRRIALCTQRPEGPQPVPPAIFEYTRSLFECLAAAFDCALVAHYANEVPFLQAQFGRRLPVLYAYDPADYIDLYDGFDLTVTTRVHGAGLCASLGVPSVIIRHSARSGTAEGFLSMQLAEGSHPAAETAAMVASLDIAARSNALIAHRTTVEARWLALLSGFFGTGPAPP